MYAPVVTRFVTFDVPLDAPCAACADRIQPWPDFPQWVVAAARELEQIDALDVEF